MQIGHKLASVITLPLAVSALSFSLLSSPALAVSACLPGSVASYSGVSCSVGPLTFSNISVTTTTTGTAVISNQSFSIFNNGIEFGLILGYSAAAQFPPALSNADLLWTYDVVANAGFLITDAFLRLNSVTTGSGSSTVKEVLSNGVTLQIIQGALGNTTNPLTVFFPGVSSLSVSKDQATIVGASAGFSSTSELTNAFSVTAVPLPGALPLFVGGLGLLGFLARRHRKGMTEALA